MTIAACPSCHENVTLPADAQPDSIVRCPLCQEQFELREFLAQLPPELIVVDNPRSTAEPMAAWTFPRDVAADADEADEAGEGGPHAVMPSWASSTGMADSAGEAPPFNFTPGSAPEASVVVESAFRPPRARKKPAVELAKIVAGGLLAVPLALLILLWLPGKWQRDPLRIGPSIGRVLPWIVPTNCRPMKWRSSPEVLDDVTARRRPRRPNAHRAAPAMPRPAPQSASPAPRESPVEAASASARPNRPPRATEPQPASNIPPLNSSTGTATPPVDASPNAAAAPANEMVVGVKGAAQRSGKELHDALEAAVQANAAWDTRTSESRAAEEKLTNQLYAAFARLGEVITFVDPRDDGVRESVGAVQSLLMSMAMHPAKLASLGNQAFQWLDRTDRASQGILLFGTVKKTRFAGQLYETELELASRTRRAVFIMSRMDPKRVYGPKDRVLILGTIVDDPSANLAGYDGKQPQVVMAGFPVPMGR